MIVRSRLNVLTTLLLGNLAMVQAVSQTGTPAQTVYDETHELWLMTTLNPDNCTASGKLVWKPQEKAPELPLIVADAYEIEVKIQKLSDEVLVWNGKWTWEDEEQCGKKKCTNEKKLPVKGISNFTIGERLKIWLSGEENVIQINKSIKNPIKKVVTSKKSVIIETAFSQFAPPPNPPPDPRAVLQPPGLCAKILKNQVHVANFHILIVRRLR